jgi:non-ribosomal peptide synthetase component F
MKINIIEYFVETVGHHAQKTAIVDGACKVTFGEADSRARLLAKVIIDTCGCKNQPVAVFMPRAQLRPSVTWPSHIAATPI